MDRLKVGGIYTVASDIPYWILAIDEAQVFYDTWWSHTNNWSTRSHNGKRIFGRSFRKDFEFEARHIGYESISDEEMIKYKYNLPLSLCRFSNLNWGNEAFSSINEFKNFCGAHKVSLRDEVYLKTNSIMLVPIGPSGGLRKGKLVYADNNGGFTETELLWKAFNFQSEMATNIKEGVGLYRLGWESNEASYYLGGMYDLADYYRMLEELQS